MKIRARHLLLATTLLLAGGLVASEAGATGRGSAAVTPPTAGTTVAFKTNLGTFHILLYKQKAPKTVANILTYVRAGHYNGTIFHRVIDNFMIQGGGYTKANVKKATRAPIVNEADNGLKNLRGTVAMARTSDPHSASAQFFVNVRTNAFLNHSSKTPRGWGYCVFGKISKGMAVVDKIKSLPTAPQGMHRNAPVTQVVIQRAWVVK